MLLFWVLAALGAPWLAPFPPNATLVPFAPPGTAFEPGGIFLLGTDHLGRDILSRILYGARTVLLYAPLATGCAYAVGITMGLAAGYQRGWVDALLSGASNVVLAFPVLVLYVLIIATVGASAVNIVLAITCASAPGIMRLVRGLTLDLRQRDYVAAAQLRGGIGAAHHAGGDLAQCPGTTQRGRLFAPRLRHHRDWRARLSRPRSAASHA